MSALVVLDLLGIFVFALSGAAAAVSKQLDLFGVLVLASVAALGGGLLRDVLLGSLPPAALRDSRYLLVPLLAGFAVFLRSSFVERLASPVRLLDAAGLGLFVAAGTTKALDAGLGAVPAVALGSITGIGGGIARDLLVGEVPVVLRRELYAVPAILGAALVVAGDGLGTSRVPTLVSGALLVFVLRVVGIWRDWHFPVALPDRSRRSPAPPPR